MKLVFSDMCRTCESRTCDIRTCDSRTCDSRTCDSQFDRDKQKWFEWNKISSIIFVTHQLQITANDSDATRHANCIPADSSRLFCRPGNMMTLAMIYGQQGHIDIWRIATEM